MASNNNATNNFMPNKGVLNEFTVRPMNLVQYNAFNGVTDFSQIGQFTMYEKGYQMLAVLSMPPFIDMLAEKDQNAKLLADNFRHILENEFRGMDGLPDLTGDAGMNISDGINEQNLIGKVSRDTSIQISMSFYEKIGTPLIKFCNYYLTGIKDPATQARTYHNLIRYGLMQPSYTNEVFTMMYIATDSTMMRLEKAVLLANCQLTKAEESIYNGNRSDIGSSQEITIEFNAYPIYGYEVDKAAHRLLENRTGVEVTQGEAGITTFTNHHDDDTVLALDSYAYEYGIFKDGNPSANQDLIELQKQTEATEGKKYLDWSKEKADSGKNQQKAANAARNKKSK